MGKVHVYLDGSNLYHQAKKAYATGKIEFPKIHRNLILGLGNEGRTYYFNSVVAPPSWENALWNLGYAPGQSLSEEQKQRVYERKNEMEQARVGQARFHTHLGKVDYLEVHLRALHRKKRECPQCGLKGGWHEKGVDVGIAVALLSHASHGLFQIAVLGSNDGDLVPAVKAVQALGRFVYHLKVRKSPGNALDQACDKTLFLEDFGLVVPPP
ncbi:NYN domain-containing protein [bacterium]|nr:NYN domain-containing protein [bacterium]